jgi:hypothetical protein
MFPDDPKYLPARALKLQEALKMLYDLLEAYAPWWYTKEHHDKAEAGLRSVESHTDER